MSRDRSDGKGFIAVWRSIREDRMWFTYHHRTATRFEAWLDLLLSASYHPETLYDRGEILELQRGQVLTSVLSLSERWRWSRVRTGRFLNQLESDRKIVQKRDKRRTILTICNYSKWQDVLPTNESTKESSEKHQKSIRKAHSTIQNHSEPSGEDPPTPPPVRSEAVGRRVGGNGMEPEGHPRPGSQPSWWEPGLAESLVRDCRNIALTLKAIDLVTLDAHAPMSRLAHERDPETIREVFTHFVRSRRRPLQITFTNFFRYYEEHEVHTVEALEKTQ